MVQKSLLHQLEEVASRIRLLEREKAEAVARAQALEREVGELASLIAQANEKVDEILRVGINDDVSKPQAVNAPAEPKGLGHLTEFSADPKKQPKPLLPHAFIPD